MHKKDVSDEFLLERVCLYGDDQSLCTFAYTFVKDHQVAEELVADTFCTIWLTGQNSACLKKPGLIFIRPSEISHRNSERQIDVCE